MIKAVFPERMVLLLAISGWHLCIAWTTFVFDDAGKRVVPARRPSKSDQSRCSADTETRNGGKHEPIIAVRHQNYKRIHEGRSGNKNDGEPLPTHANDPGYGEHEEQQSDWQGDALPAHAPSLDSRQLSLLSGVIESPGPKRSHPEDQRNTGKMGFEVMPSLFTQCLPVARLVVGRQVAVAET